MRRLLLAVCLMLVGCSGEGEPEAREAPATTSAPAPESACPNQEAVVADSSLRNGEPESGDVDGDGETDAVTMYFDPAGAPGCQAFVVAESAAGTIAGPLDAWRDEFGLPVPTLHGLVDVEGDGDDEVVVNVGAGASTQFVGIVAADGGVLRQVTAGDAGQAPPGSFAFGGSVGHLDAVDCAPDGGVVASSALPDGDLYRVERRFYDLSGADLIREDREVERVSIHELDRFPEYTASPFGSCR